MPRYIDADALRKKILNTRFAVCYDLPWNRWWIKKSIGVVNKILEIIKEFPSADVEEVRHGEWIYRDAIEDLFPADSTKECNQCHARQNLFCDNEYCPRCGAKMDGGAGRELKALRRMEGKRMNVKTFKLEDGRRYLVPARSCFNCKNLGLVLYDDGGPHTIMCELSEDEKYADYAADMGLKCDAFEEKEEEKGEEK